MLEREGFRDSSGLAAIRFADSWVLGGWFSWGSARTSLHPRLMATAPPVLDLRVGLRRAVGVMERRRPGGMAGGLTRGLKTAT